MKSENPEPNLTFLHRYLLAALAGVLYCLAFVGFDQCYLAWICLVPLFFALEGVSPKRGFFMGWLAGTVAMTGGFYWVTYTIHVFANMPWIVSGIGCLLLSIAQGTEFALFGLLYAYLRKRTGITPLVLGIVAFVTAEFISPQLFPHFFAASQYRILPLIQICDITGVLGLSALLVFVNACLYLILTAAITEKRFRWGIAATASLSVLAVAGYGYMRTMVVKTEMDEAPKLRFGIAQVNLGIREKDRFPQKAIRLNQEQTRKLKEMGADIVVWPETAIKDPIIYDDSVKLDEAVFDELDLPIITGTLLEDFSGDKPRAYNVAVLTDNKGDILDIYKKQKLLMLGEYIPMGKTFPVLYEWFPYISDFTFGDSNEPLRFGDYKLNINICYEEILPRLMRKMALYSPHVFINLTNDNWFGKTFEPYQHFALSIFRSVEHRRWLVRSTNTGISAFVDATGRIVEQSPLMEPAMLIQDVPMMDGETLYTRFGDWFGWVCMGLVIMFIGFGKKKQAD